MCRICHHIQSLGENNRLQKSLVYVSVFVALTKKKEVAAGRRTFPYCYL